MFNWSASWTAMVLSDKVLTTNKYKVSIAFDTAGKNVDEEIIAFERIKYLFEILLPESMFVDLDNPWTLKFYKDVEVPLVTIPEAPIDINVGIAILSKILCIIEGRLDVYELKISSDLSNNVESIIDIDDLQYFPWLIDNPVKQLSGKPAWFMRNDAGTADIVEKTKKKTIIHQDDIQWESFDLGWEPNAKAAIQPPSNRPPSIMPPIKGWKPKVINGGKSE